MSQRPPKKNRSGKKSQKARSQQRAKAQAQQQATAQNPPQSARTVAAAAEPTSSDRRHARREAAARKEQQKKQMRIIGGGVAAVAIIAVILIFVNRPTNEGAAFNYDGLAFAQPPIAAAAATPESSPEDGQGTYTGATLGDPNAPVRFVVYADYQCHFCVQFHENSYPQILDNFVRDGQVMIEFREFPALGDAPVTDDSNESAQAAEAAMCAGEQDSYLEYHDRLYANFGGLNQGAFSNNRLKQFAADIGLNTDQFNECLESGRYEPAVIQSLEEGRALGITATPMFIIDNGTGEPNVVQQTAQGYDLLERQIETAIETAQ